MQNLAKVVEDLGMKLGMEDIRKILLCCSQRGDRISFSEFHHIMTRKDKDDFSGKINGKSRPGATAETLTEELIENSKIITLQDS